ncbi:MAG: HDOD domain-containing protein [Verrucomicrobia bacterium]|nr:HDOD domain-containing protein [Verrucomicrobiota bacterium]
MEPDFQSYRDVVHTAKDLPTLSSVVHRLHEMIRNPNVSAADIGQLIAQDVALASTTLKLVNSAFYGLSQKVNSVTHAIVILGFNKVKNIALAASILKAFENCKSTDFDYLGFWEHSIGTATAAEVLARSLRSPYTDEAFISGLLHDQGKLILVQYFPEEFQKVSTLIHTNRITMHKAEQEVMGFDHSLVGTWLAEKWKFPEHLSLAIRMHHKPAMARQHNELIQIVHTADILCRALNIGNGGDPFISELDTQIWTQMNLTEQRVDDLLGDISTGMSNASEFLELVRQ